MTIPIDLIWDAAWKIGFPVVLLLLALWGFYFDKIVTKTKYDKMEADYIARLAKCDLEMEKWQQLALTLGGVSDQALTVAERHAKASSL